MATSESSEEIKLLFGMGALMSDLKRLEAQATSQGFLIAATLIGAAAEAVSDEMQSTVSEAASISSSDQNGKSFVSDGSTIPTRQRLS